MALNVDDIINTSSNAVVAVIVSLGTIHAEVALGVWLEVPRQGGGNVLLWSPGERRGGKGREGVE